MRLILRSYYLVSESSKTLLSCFPVGIGAVATLVMVFYSWCQLLWFFMASQTAVVIHFSQPRGNIQIGTWSDLLFLASAGLVMKEELKINNSYEKFYTVIKILNMYQYALYSDKDLQTALVGNGAYTSGGTISRIFYEYCSKVYSDQKIAPFEKNTIDLPGFEETENVLKFYPLDETCSECTLDYISQPPSAAGTPRVNTSDTVDPICRGGKFTTQSTSLLSNSSFE